MKQSSRIFVFALPLLLFSCIVSAQENITIVTPVTEVAEGLDLYAVVEIFKDSKNLEEFEQALNDPDIGVNNLDLDRDGYVDYIRVVEQVTGYTHVILLQVPSGDNEFQDIVTIEIDKIEDENYRIQIRGNKIYYGSDYYISPGYIRVYNWPIVTWIFRSFYRPYRSIFYFGYYPRWWKPYRPVTVYNYRSRTARHTRRANFYMNRTGRLTTGHDVDYKPFTDRQRETKVNRDHAVPQPDKSDRYDRPPVPREARASVNTRLRMTNKKTFNKEPNKSIKPKSRKDAHIKREAKEPTRAGVMKPSSSKNGVNKTSKQKVEKKLAVDRGERIKTVKEKAKSLK